MSRIMNCSKCGKFMQFESITINQDKSISEWHCKCGELKSTESESHELFCRDAFALVLRDEGYPKL